MIANSASSAEKPIANQKKARNSNFRLFHKYKGKESYLVFFMYKYCLIDIQYIQNIKKNKFKPKSNIKLSISVRCTKK